ncbi:NHL repeat-containing protein [Tunturibacter empetritectus]|uniref:Sugar lactone lactonase YvrE n=2 Tax=Tunturiibacter empetritectus TaxID=3069691 RepID=A0A7W8IIU4_9BACT|nr:hypothetical protein [Edaphobacter lichenicola]MBB5317256.1 sugar lactone lactonase YvrE [Edaphobacter lichenicola]
MRVVPAVVLCVPLTSLLFLLTGCSSSPSAATPPPTPTPGNSLTVSGSVHHGQMPISGAHVYLFAANTTGYGQSSVSLLDASLTGASDSIGAYVTTAADGSFSMDSGYSCVANSQVYLYALGGNTGPGVNSASGLMAELGNCHNSGNFNSSAPVIWVNEVSTVAAAYAMAGFAADATHVSSSGTLLARTGIANAFANAANLAAISSGAALATTPAGNGTVPQSTINTLADILGACIGSIGPSSKACSTLLINAPSSGSNGTLPTDTATAAINIAHNPASNVATLYALAAATPLFSPTLTTQPNDFTVGLNFTGSGLSESQRIVIDGSGNAWVINTSSVTEFSSSGSALSGANGFTAGGINNPQGIAIDNNGNAWIANTFGGNVVKLSSSGSVLSGVNGYIGIGGVGNPESIAIDSSGNAWIANFFTTVSELSNSGTAISPVNGFTGGGLNYLRTIAISGPGSVWIVSQASNTVTELSNSGAVLSGPNGYTGGGISEPWEMALDNSGNAWIANGTGNSITKLSSSGSFLSGPTGFTGGGLYSPTGIAIDGAGNAWIANFFGSSVVELSNSGSILSGSKGYTGGGVNPDAIAIDCSGNVWTTNGDSVTEIIGAATPVVTPLVANLMAPYSAPASKP